MSDLTHEHGWTVVPHSLSKIVEGRPNKITSKPMTVQDISLPGSQLAKDVMAHAKGRLSPETFRHGMRVFYYGQAIVRQHFPEWRFSPETLFLAAMLHDIATTPEAMSSTRLSFEFAGGYHALELLKSLHAEIAQAESVCETIIRHQDLGETGSMTTLTAVIHFATVLDNAGLFPELVAKETIESVTKAYPRNGWTGCFASLVRDECRLKPWSNTTRIEGFAEMVEANTLMEPYDH